jgi:hypothetical protein
MVQDSAEGVSRMYVRLLDQNGWKFDDVMILQANGRDIGLWGSQIAANPDLLAIRLAEANIGQAWNSAVKVTDDLGRIVDAFAKFKALAEPERETRHSDPPTVDPSLF